MNKSRWLLFTLLFTLCTGCATTSNPEAHDPREGGLIGGIQGMSSGAYDERLKNREASLQRLKRIRQELEAEQAALQADKQRKQQRVRKLEQELAILNAETTKLSNDISFLEKTLSSSDTRIVHLKNRTIRLNANIKHLNKQSQTNNPDRRQLEKRAQSLRDEYNKLVDLYLELSK